MGEQHRADTGGGFDPQVSAGAGLRSKKKVNTITRSGHILARCRNLVHPMLFRLDLVQYPLPSSKDHRFSVDSAPLLNVTVPHWHKL